DTVSWRILLPDLQSAWMAIAAGHSPGRLATSTPIRLWAQHLAANAAARAPELPAWEEILNAPGQLVPGATLDATLDTVASARRLASVVSPRIAAVATTMAPHAFHATTTDVLLAALVVAIDAWRRRRGDARGPIVVDLEGHGRDAVEGLDVGRTVGWFTSVYP